MKPSDFQKTIQCQFECKLKKVMVRGLIKKYNKYHTDKLPNITPHSFRHTYCTNMAKRGISVETLKYLMGHTDISVTLNVYTHLKLEDAEKEIKRLENVEKELKKCAR